MITMDLTDLEVTAEDLLAALTPVRPSVAEPLDPTSDAARCVECGHLPECECPHFCETEAEERARFAAEDAALIEMGA